MDFAIQPNQVSGAPCICHQESADVWARLVFAVRMLCECCDEKGFGGAQGGYSVVGDSGADVK